MHQTSSQQHIVVFRKALFLSESLHMPYSAGYSHLHVRKQNHRKWINFLKSLLVGQEQIWERRSYLF